MNYLKLVNVLLVLSIGSFTGCASIIKGARQDVPIASIPNGASVTIDGVPHGSTPTKVALTRKHSHSITLEKEGYVTENITVSPRIGMAVAGNIIAGGLVGWGVDAVTGAQYNLKPESINVTLHLDANENTGDVYAAIQPVEVAMSPSSIKETGNTVTSPAKPKQDPVEKPSSTPSGFFAGGIFGRKEQKPKTQPAAQLAELDQSEAATPAPDKIRAKETARIVPAMIAKKEEKAQEPAPLGLRVGILNYDICVSEVAKGSAAEKAGIRAGDRILSFGTMTYANSGMLVAKTINNIKAGELLVNWDSPYGLEPKTATLKWGDN